MEQSPSPAWPPFISVVVPVYNEERYVRRCAEALLGQSYPRGRFEILMVDNNSTDRSREILHSIDGVCVLEEPEQGDYAARNRGVAASRGEIIAFTDSDTAPLPDWLDRIAQAMAEQPDVGVIVGGLRFAGSSRTLSLMAAYEEDKAEYIFGSDDAELYYGYTCNLAARRRLFEELGPFASVPRNADVVFVRNVVDAYSTDAVVYRRDVAVRRLEIASTGDFFQKQSVYGRDFPRYAKLTRVRPLRMSERWSILRRVVRKRRHTPIDVGLLIAALSVGALCYDVARWWASARGGRRG
jgi:glycosyltransferase involved in cell wall biosynthesis